MDVDVIPSNGSSACQTNEAPLFGAAMQPMKFSQNFARRVKQVSEEEAWNKRSKMAWVL